MIFFLLSLLAAVVVAQQQPQTLPFPIAVTIDVPATVQFQLVACHTRNWDDKNVPKVLGNTSTTVSGDVVLRNHSAFGIDIFDFKLQCEFAGDLSAPHSRFRFGFESYCVVGGHCVRGGSEQSAPDHGWAGLRWHVAAKNNGFTGSFSLVGSP